MAYKAQRRTVNAGSKQQTYQETQSNAIIKGMPLHHTRWTGCRTMPSPMQHNPDITT
jgi:hypothetical protein